MAKRILLVDDEPLILKGLKFSLEQDGYETDTAADGEEALAKMRNGGYDIVLLDVLQRARIWTRSLALNMVRTIT